MAVFANVELGWKSMIYLTLTGRQDWDSALSNTTNYSFFYPSVGMSAIISQMVKMPAWWSYLKVRGSWASVGSPIPVNISSDPRSGAKQAAAEFKTAGSDVSKWPEGIGFAA